MKPALGALYAEHLATLQTRVGAWLLSQDYQGLVIDSGLTSSYYRDDIQVPYRANPQLLHWLPLLDAPGSVLIIRPQQPPLLQLQQAPGFWHQHGDYTASLWHGLIEQVVVEEATPASIANTRQLVYLGPHPERAVSWGIDVINPDTLLVELDWLRAYKSPYEQVCMRKAAALAKQGHQAVEQGFAGGLSEWQLHLRYLQAVGQAEEQLPYPNIIAINEHAAVLHYQQRSRHQVDPRYSLLIDAGASFNGYGADVSRTYAAQPGLFADLLAAVESAQQRLIRSLTIGSSYVEVHQQACLLMAAVLQQAGLVDMTPEEQLQTGLIQHFFPHGVGHLLGLQVHDVGGRQASVAGGVQSAPAEHPFLRLTRMIEKDMVFTIEPGLYFIPSLLQSLQQGVLSDCVDWSAVAALTPYGGIRIEDNVLMQEAGAVQLTC